MAGPTSKYIEDKNLEFLGKVSTADLDPLVQFLLEDQGMGAQSNLHLDDDFKKHRPNHAKYWKEIAADIQTWGANTLATMWRDMFGSGGGVLYRELLIEACESAEINFNKNSDIEVIEGCLLAKTMENAFEKMNSEELKIAVDTMGINTTNLTAQGAAIALQAAVKAGGFSSYKLALIFANTALNKVGGQLVLGAGARFAINKGLVQGMAVLSGPIGWGVTGAWTAAGIAGPAKRVTLPACVHVAYLRQLYLHKN